MIFLLLRLGGLITWTYFICRHGWDFSLHSLINPVRHEMSWEGFCFFYVIAILLHLIFEPAFMTASPQRRPAAIRFGGICFVLLVLWLTTMFSWMLYHAHHHPYRCENMPGKFPVFVEFGVDKGNLRTGMGVDMATVWVDGKKLYQVSHDEQFGRVHTFLSAEYLRDGKKKRTLWPRETAVSDLWTNFTRGADLSDGTLTGNCNQVHCLEGKFWMTPNLRYTWTYRNPVTGEIKRKTVQSNEGEWFFRQRHRPLVSLTNGNGTEVFRAQSTKVVCSAGDGDYETSLVPVGLLLLAEQIYSGFGF
jgi:hypothetical protein